MHARPAALFVQTAARFKDTKVEVVKDGTVRDAKSILGVLTLGVSQGTTIMVRADGTGKVLDFGLAKLIPTEGPEVSTLPTAAVPTRPGVVLGTVGVPNIALVEYRADLADSPNRLNGVYGEARAARVAEPLVVAVDAREVAAVGELDLEIRRNGLRAGFARFNRAAHASPDVQFPRDLQRQ